MTPKLTLPHLLLRSLLHRRARGLSALIALSVSAAVATALLTLYADLDRKMHQEFRSFGANLTITATTAGQPLPPDTLARARAALPANTPISPIAYAVATTSRGTPIVVAGVDFPTLRTLNTWWQVSSWPNTPTDALAGIRAATTLSTPKPTLLYNNRPLTLHTAGTLRTGADEDSRLYIPLTTFTAWTGITPSLLEVQIPGGATAVNQALQSLHTALPTLRVDPVRQLVTGETSIVDKTHALMVAAVLLISITVGVSVLATLSASVLERRRDFALMKALGSSQASLSSLFLLEALTLATLAILAGWLLGSAAAWLISELNFHTATLPNPRVLPAVALLDLAIALLAALAPLQSLRRLQPASLLRGE